MKVELDQLPYRMAYDMMQWCYENNIDKEQSVKLILELSKHPSDWDSNLEWSLEIPEEYLSFFTLKWL